MTTKPAAFAAFAAAMFAMPVTAMHLNPRGLGDLLLYPYYTVQRGQDTLLTVVNPEGVAKIVKLRFTEGWNGRPVLELDVFLGPNDVWAAAISADGPSGAKLTTPDSSCTVPAVPPGGIAFTTAHFDGSGPLPSDAWPNDPARVREGSIEMISMGVISSDSPAGLAITRPSGTAPDCAALRSNLPSNGGLPGAIHGSAAIVDIAEGTFYGYTPEAISGFWQYGESPYAPSAPSWTPSLDAPGPDTASYEAVFPGGPTVTYETRIDALSALLAANWVDNEYLVARDLGGATDWIVAFPTKAYYTDPAQTGGTAPREPFAEAPANGRSTTRIGYALFDREQRRSPPSPAGPPVFAPLALPYQVNVLDVRTDPATAEGSGVFGSKLATSVPALGTAGRVRLDMNTSEDAVHALRTGTVGGLVLGPPGPAAVYGLPVIGFMAYDIINAQAQPGRLANYSGVFRHRAGGTVCQRASALTELCAFY